MSDRDEVLNLMERYCWTVDHGDYDAWLECFTEDGTFVVRGERPSGKTVLRAFIQKEVGDAFSYVRHLIHNPMVEVVSTTEARGRSYFELRGTTVKGSDFEALGSYEDQIVKTGEGWRFKERKARFDYFVPRGGSLSEGGDGT